MKAFLDTSVLVATFYGDDERHESSFELFTSLNKKSGCIGTHSLAETYAVLTRMPGKEKASPDEALLFLGDVSARLLLVDLTAKEYFETLEQAAAVGITGGTIYDALLGACAAKAGAEHIYTWNRKHFSQLSEAVARRIRTP